MSPPAGILYRGSPGRGLVNSTCQLPDDATSAAPTPSWHSLRRPQIPCAEVAGQEHDVHGGLPDASGTVAGGPADGDTPCAE